MDERKEKNEMSVELAVRRELDSQRKQARSGFHPLNTSREQVPLSRNPIIASNSSSKPMPAYAQVPLSSSYPVKPSNPYSKPMPTNNQFQNRPQVPFPKPVPKPTSESNPNPSGNKRKEMMNDIQEPRRPNPLEPDHITKISHGYSYCNLCEIPCPGFYNLEQHLKGKQHKNKLQLLEWTKKGDSPPFCDICHVFCSDKGGLKMHKDGQKHQAKVRKLEDGGDRKKHRVCDFCNIGCMNEAAYQQHLRGKEHMARVYREEHRKNE